MRLSPDHLRVCGADANTRLSEPDQLGSSPRVRSRLHGRVDERLEHRIISACAEQTSFFEMNLNGSRDHLRVCGADRSVQHIERTGRRIISACAEQTPSSRCTTFQRKDHLRVCGADFMMSWSASAAPGSSPRVRSRLEYPAVVAKHLRIISACAEQTNEGDVSDERGADHLRVCGADTSSALLP